MKSVLLLLIFISYSTSSLFSQNFTVKVLSGNEPVAYAYIFINNSIICSADSNGIAIFPQKLLKSGDTISVSFVGSKPEMFIYNNDAADKRECTIKINETVYLNDITIKGQDASNKMFKRSVKPLFVGNWYDYYTGVFNLSVMGTGVNKDISGDFKYTALPYNPKKRGLKSNLEINTNSDTLNFENQVRSTLFMYSNALYSAVLWKGAYMNKGLIAVYKGETPLNRIFLITRPRFYSDKSVDDMQQLIYIDKKSGYLNSADILIIGRNGDWRYSFKAYYRIDKRHKNIYPSNVEGVFSIISNIGEFNYNVIIDQIEYHRKR